MFVDTAWKWEKEREKEAFLNSHEKTEQVKLTQSKTLFLL